MPHKILLLIEEAEERSHLRSFLEENLYQVVESLDSAPDLIILDKKELCKEIRLKAPYVLLVVLQEKEEEQDREGIMVEALEKWQADQCLVNYTLRELLAQIRALLRRAQPLQILSPTLGDFNVMDLLGIYRGETRIDLTQKEYVLFRTLMTYPAQVLQYSFLVREVLHKEMSKKAYHHLGVIKSHLQAKLEKGGNKTYIITIPEVGYKFLPWGSKEVKSN